MVFSGAKGGGGSTFKQTPDNLRSIDTFEGVLGLGLGPFKGPVNGLESIKVDGTQVENATGKLNFKDFVVNFADGDPLKHPQMVALKLGAGSSPIPVGLTLTNLNGTNPTWITKTVPNLNADFIDLRFVVSQLFRQTKSGIFNETLTLKIQLKPTGSTTWIDPTIHSSATSYAKGGYNFWPGWRTYLPRDYFNDDGTDYRTVSNYSVTGKTTSPSVYELRIAVPNTGAYANTTWDVRVQLVERDSYDNGDDKDPIQEKRSVSWESVSAVYEGNLGGTDGWMGVSWLQIYGKASDQLTGIPEITGEYETKIVAVPPSSLFNPDTRVYQAGVWDGSWEYAYTNDPAWCVADLLADPIGGVSAFAPGTYLNKWDALEASKWFSEQVPNGDGGYHCRFSMNVALNDKQKADDLVRYVAGAVGGLAWDDGNGEWRLRVDKPEAAVDIFTLENISGDFSYQHTDVDTRFNDITGKFLNEELDYTEDTVRLFDNDVDSPSAISKIGRKATTIALVGCTNRQEAMRRVMLRLRSACREVRIVNFTTNRRGKNIAPLDTILVADGDLGDSDQRTTGRIVSVAPDRMSVTVRDDLRLEVGVAYSLNFTANNPLYDPEPTSEPTDPNWTKPTLVITRAVTNTAAQRGNVKTLYLDAALPDDVVDYLTVALEADNLTTLPKAYRTLSIEPQDDGELITITAVEIDTGKWDAMDGVSKEDSVYVGLRGQPQPPLLVGDTLLTLTISPAEQGKNITISASWEKPADRRVAAFRVRHNVNGGQWIDDLHSTQITDFDLVNPGAGVFEFEITSLGRDGQTGGSLTESIEITQQLIDFVYADGTPIDELRPDDIGSTRNVPAQLLQDSVFLDDYWTMSPGATAFALSHAPSGYALEVPHVDDSDNFSFYGGANNKFMETHPGKKLWVRFNCDNTAHQLFPLTSGGVELTSGGVPLTSPAYNNADWNLQVAMDWFAADGTPLVTTDPAQASFQNKGVLYLDFAGSYYRTDTAATDLDELPGYAYARAGSKFEFDAANGLASFAADTPGIVDGYGYFSRGPLTNLLERSQEFDDAAWPDANVTVTPDAALAPDGTMTADALVRTAFAGNHFARQNPAVTPGPGTTATFSVFAKAKSVGNQFGLYADCAPDPGGSVGAKFDLIAGTVVGSSGALTDAAGISDCGDGWFRCWITFTLGATYALNRTLCGPSDPSTTVGGWFMDTPGVLSDCYVWGAQLVLGAEPGPYIPTVANPVTAGPDALSVDLAAPAAIDLTNEFLQSQAFDNAVWAKTRTAATANATAAPDGTLTADALARTSTTQSAFTTQTLAATHPVGTRITASVYAKAKSAGGRLGLRLTSTYPNRADAVFDLAAGVVVGSAQVSYTDAVASVQDCGDGWYLCALTATVGGDDFSKVTLGPTDPATTIGAWEGFGGAVLSDCYVWGAQLAVGDSVGPYVPTTTAAATAQVDSTSYNATITFDDDSIEQMPAVIVNGTFTVPTYPAALNRPLVKSVFLGDANASVVMFQRTALAEVMPITSEQAIVATVIPPPLARKARLLFGNKVETGHDGSWAVWSPWVAEHQPAADITGENAPTMPLGPNQEVGYASDGLRPSAGELPRTVANKRFLGGLEVTKVSEWTAEFDGMTATIDNDPASPLRGAITVTEITQTTASATITSDYEGVPLTDVQVWTKAIAPAPIVSSSMVTAEVSTEIDVAQTDYGPVSASATISVADGQTLITTAPLIYSVTAGTANVAGVWQYAPAGSGLWTNFGTEITGETAAKIKWYEPEQGSIYVNQSVTGLAAGDYDVRLLLRHFTGTATTGCFGNATMKAA